jgi:hypothetical protein
MPLWAFPGAPQKRNTKTELTSRHAKKWGSTDTVGLEVVPPFAAKLLNHEVGKPRVDKKRTVCSRIKQSRHVERHSIVSYGT